MKKLLLIAGLVLFAGVADAQIYGPGFVIPVVTAPSGACASVYLPWEAVLGSLTLWGCNGSPGTWAEVSGGGGGGGVSSFSSGNLSPLFTTSVATATTTPALSFTLSSQTQNLFFASPNGSSGVPTFRAIVGADIPTLNQNTMGNAATATNLATYPTLCSGGAFSQGLSSGSNNCATPSGGGTSIGGTVTSGVANNVLFLYPTATLAQDAAFQWYPVAHPTGTGQYGLSILDPEPDLSGLNGPGTTISFITSSSNAAGLASNWFVANSAPNIGFNYYLTGGSTSAPTQTPNNTGWASGVFACNQATCSTSTGSGFINANFGSYYTSTLGSVMYLQGAAADGTHAAEFEIRSIGAYPEMYFGGAGFSAVSSTEMEVNNNTPVGAGGSLIQLDVASIKTGAGPACTATTGGVLGCAGEGGAPSPGAASGVDVVYADSTKHALLASYNNGSYFPLTQTIASGTAAMNTAAVASGACETVVTVSATGVATTDAITVGFNGDPTAVTGYGASASGAVLTIYPYPTANNINIKVCNSTANSITPGALTLNWRVVR